MLNSFKNAFEGGGGATALAMAFAVFAGWKWVQERRTADEALSLRDSISETERKHAKELRNIQHKRNDERRGRLAAEKEVKELIEGQSEAVPGVGVASNLMRMTGTGYTRPIGTLRSVFKERNGTPRQGTVVSSSRAKLSIDLGHGTNAIDALCGLETFSHMWIIYVFHQNTNVGHSKVKAKVKPPRLDGIKTGLFATRTPHRPNPIGLSVVKIEKIEGSTVYMSGVDLLDGTPVLDIKPYVPTYDALGDALTPAWINGPPLTSILSVEWSAQAVTDLGKYMRELELYDADEVDVVQEAINQVLQTDIRSEHRRKSQKCGDEEQKYGFCFDNLNVLIQYVGVEGITCHVTGVELWDKGIESGRRDIAEKKAKKREKKRKKGSK